MSNLACGHDSADRPVLYLDIDDTLLSWAEGSPRAAPGAASFVGWALEHFEVRWLTTWCPDGEMPRSLLGDLCRMLQLEPSTLEGLCGFDWSDTGSKLDGIAWLEHTVRGRPFLWVEDDYGFTEREAAALRRAGLLDRYRHCNVSEDPDSLRRLHQGLRSELAQGHFAWRGSRDARGEAA